jgi:hypothetical protein
MKHIWIIAASAAMLAACGSKSSGGVTAEEAAGLNNAAEMLDTSPDSLVAPDETPLGNGDESVAVDENAAANVAQ